YRRSDALTDAHTRAFALIDWVRPGSSATLPQWASQSAIPYETGLRRPITIGKWRYFINPCYTGPQDARPGIFRPKGAPNRGDRTCGDEPSWRESLPAFPYPAPSRKPARPASCATCPRLT